jgi:hypothetical protein
LADHERVQSQRNNPVAVLGVGVQLLILVVDDLHELRCCCAFAEHEQVIVFEYGMLIMLGTFNR